VDGIVLALNAPCQFDVFNLGNCHPVRIDTMVNTLGSALQRPVIRKFTPTPTGEMLKTHADVGKAQKVLGYFPKVSFEEGIQRFAKWLRVAA
jgi:UDP-glucuronate 4-epimerase